MRTPMRRGVTASAALAAVATGLVASSLVAPAGRAAAATTIMRPDGDVVRQWTGTPGSAWAAIDDPVTQPTAVPGTDYIYGSVAGRVTEVTLGGVAHGGTATVTPWFFANTGAGTTLRVDVVAGGAALRTATVPPGSGFAWRSLTAVTTTQAQTQDLRLRFTALDGGDTNVRAAYASIVTQGLRQTWGAPGTSLGEWRVRQQPAPPTPPRLTIATPPRVKNGTALRVELRDGDVAVNAAGQPIPGGWRAEGVAPPVEVASGAPVTYEWSTMLDASYPQVPSDVWQVITQWHQGDDDFGGPPPIAFTLVGDEIRLDLHQPHPTEPRSVEGPEYRVATLDRGAWHDFRMEVRWALTNGYVKVWHNGRLVREVTGISTLFPLRSNRSAPGTAYFKMGLYREAVPLSSTFVLYHDEVRRLVPQ